MQSLLDALQRSDPILGGAGLVAATSLVLAVLLLVPREERRLARGPLWLLVGHLVLAGLLIWIPKGHAIEQGIALFSLLLILSSIARSSFVLFVHSFWMRRFARPVPKILRDVIQAFIYAAVALTVMHSAGVEPGSLLTTSALLTAVIGLSLQDTLGNLFAGLAIQAQRPFDVGDWIQFDQQGEHIGKVIEINWRATRVLTLERFEITVPNAAVAKAPIVNYTRPTPIVRRDVLVYASYDASPEFIHQLLTRAVNHVPEVLLDPPPSVVTQDYTDRGMAYLVRYYIQNFDHREVIQSDVRDRLWYALRREGLVIQVPHRRIELVRRPRQETETAASTRATKNLLGQLDFFNQLPKEHSERLSERCRRRRFGSEELIVRKGDETTEMYLIESGQVRIEAQGPGGMTHTVAVLGRGDFFGEMSLMTGQARAADVVAKEETSVLILDRETLAPVLEEFPDLAQHISRILAERQSRLDQLQDFQAHETPKRQQDELLTKIRRFFSL